MSASRPSPLLSELQSDELVDDRALIHRDEDAFRLADVADELRSLCRHVTVPATVALYASWGSGKSSVSRLLQNEFKNEPNAEPRIAFARFDAFKYAEAPLRRHFLSQLAIEFGVSKNKYSEDLYKTTKGSDFGLSKRAMTRLPWVLAGAIAAVLGLVSVFSLVVAAIEKGPFRHNLGEALRSGSAGVVLSATVITALLALLTRTLTVDTSTDAPSSDEEFEKLFKELVGDICKEQRCKRIVVFIDELDRCSPAQVVGVLETLRTFLEVSPCIFIVAADQQALERALSEAARQATPLNPGNPYYSAGSAYLDKIFQYQMTLPPLLPRRLSHFALSLIQSRPGAWERLPNRAELVSVLVPTHVTSPRRVKALLNSFLLLYRLALARAGEEMLPADVAHRASEVAKLACLRTEFPLFAVDLQLDARLPQLVLRLHEEPALTLAQLALPGVSPEAFAQAKAYAREELPVAEIIARPDQVTADAAALREEPAPPDRSSPEAPPGEEPDPTKEPDTTEAENADAAEAEIVSDPGTRIVVNHARQLIRYLQRTRSIAGPGRDLVFLEAMGAVFDLPSELAERLEFDALDGQTQAVAAAVGSLDEPSQLASLRLLSRLVIESIGLEASNVLSAIFGTLPHVSAPLDSVVEEILNAATTYSDQFALRGADLAGALRLSLASEAGTALQLRQDVLARDEVVTDAALGLLVIENAAPLSSLSGERLRKVIGARLEDTEADDLLKRFLAVPLEAVADEILSLHQEALSPAALGTLGTMAGQALDEGADGLAEALLRGLLGSDSDEAHQSAKGVLPKFAPIRSAALIEDVLAATPQLWVRDWPAWLDPIDPGAVAAVDADAIADDLTSMVESLWDELFDSEADEPVDEESVTAAITAVARIKPARALARTDDLSDLLSKVEPAPATTDPQSRERQRHVDILWALCRDGLVSDEFVAALVIEDIELILRADVPTGPPAGTPPGTPVIYPEELDAYVVRETSRALQNFPPPDSLVEAVENSGWLAEGARLLLHVRLAIAAEAKSHGSSVPPTRQQLAELREAGSAQALQVLADWMRVFQPNPEDVIAILQPETKSATALPQPLHEGLTTLADGWDGGTKADFLVEVGPIFHETGRGEHLLRDASVHEGTPDRISGLLLDLYKKSTNNDQRERLLRLWEIARPTDPKAFRTLADKLFIPLLKEGKGAVKHALAHFGLVQHASGAVQERLKKSIQEAAGDDADLARRADKVLRDAGWIKRRNWFGIEF